jgi:hypothetical protein
MSHERKFAERFKKQKTKTKKNLASTALAREEISKITCFPGLKFLGWPYLSETQSLWASVL